MAGPRSAKHWSLKRPYSGEQEPGMDELATRRRGRDTVDPIIAEALATGVSHAEAARIANVSLRTITRRVGDPSFRAQIDELHARSLEGIADSLLASTATAVKTLVA